MDIVSLVLSALLFYAFVPGVLITLPSPGSSKLHILLTHAVLFSVITSLVMKYYWHNIRGYMEKFGNYGPACPVGYREGVSPTGVPDCVPVGGSR